MERRCTAVYVHLGVYGQGWAGQGYTQGAKGYPGHAHLGMVRPTPWGSGYTGLLASLALQGLALEVQGPAGPSLRVNQPGQQGYLAWLVSLASQARLT